VLSRDIRNTEVKLVLDSRTALKRKFELAEDAKDAFKVSKRPQKMRIWYLDTVHQSMMRENWSVRFRFHEQCDFELTYKKRFKKNEYLAMLESGSQKVYAGFEQEIDMGFSQQTASLSLAKTFPLTAELKNLSLDTAKHLAIRYAPDALLDCHGRNHGLGWLDHAAMYGPVFAKEYTGRFESVDITFEVWQLDEYFTEISFDIKTEKAESMRDALCKELQAKRLVLPVNTLKTEALFDYYAQHTEQIKV